MKIRTQLLLAMMFFGFSAFAAEPVMVPGNLSDVFVPDGYDSNDHIQITGHGILPSGCYKPAFSDWKRVGNDIVLSPTLYYYSGYCIQMISHSYPTFEIGMLPVGQYRVLLEKTGEVIARLSVRQANSDSADDYLYAPISQAYYERSGSKNLVKISGELTNSCLRFREVRTQVQTNVIVVLPILELVNGRNCRDGKFPFEKTMDVGRLSAGNYLIHVRSANGQAVNSLVDVR